MAIYDPIVDIFSQDEVKAPKIDENASDIGGHNMEGAWAKRMEKELWKQGQAANAERQAAAGGFAQQGAAGAAAMAGRAGAQDAMGGAGLAQGNQRADMAQAAGGGIQSAQGQQAANLQNQAMTAQGRQAPTVNLAGAQQAAQTSQGAQQGLMGNAGALGAAAANNQAQAQTAGALGANAGAIGSNASALGAAAKTPQAQTANAQALGVAGTTTAAQQGNAGAIRDFYQQGPGASMAEVQLRQGAQNAMASNLAMARSGRGGANAGAERQALFANAAQQQDTNQSMALLRAKESDDFRNRQLQAMGLETGALGTARSQDIQGLSAQTQALGQARGQDIQALMGQTGALGQATNALSAQGGLQTAARGQDIGALQGQTAALGQAGGLANQQQGIESQTALGVSGQALQQAGMNDAYATNMQQIAAGRQAAGDQAALAGIGLGNQSVAQGQQFALGAQGLGNQAMATGLGYNAQMGGLANQAAAQGYGADQAYQGMGLQTVTNQANLNMQLEALKSGQGLQAGMANAAYDQSRDAAGLGLLVGALSDVNAKTDIGPPGAYSGMNSPTAGYQQDASMVAGADAAMPQFAAEQANVQHGKSVSDAAGGGTAPGMLGMLSSAYGQIQDQLTPPPIPTYQSPGFQPVNSSYVTSDERAKKQAALEAEEFAYQDAARGMATGEISPRFAELGIGRYYENQTGIPAGSGPLREAPRPERPGEPPESIRREAGPSYRDATAPAYRAKPKPKGKPRIKVDIGDAENLSSTEVDIGDAEDIRSVPRAGPKTSQTDLRGLSNFSYAYKDPNMPGGAPGRQVGPMAQDILRTDAAPIVRQQPNGMLGVDGQRAGLVALGAQGEQQRRIDELERELAALGVRSAA
ncbi:MAG TPA: hypothetical protein VFZ21_30925 [Gemmatimonadaceae bacterium]|nr:hypothetical protein [Gemmatimonadaceae bacterium]